MRTLEDYLRLPRANVVYYDGERLQPVAEGLTYANGIAISPDGRRVYVAETTRNRIREYRRNPGTGGLEEHRHLNIGFGVDNIKVDLASGDLWIGGHVKLLTFIRYINNPYIHAPSKIVRVEMNGEDYQVFTVFMDDGRLISGTSVGAPQAGGVLIGSVFEPHIVNCVQIFEQVGDVQLNS